MDGQLTTRLTTDTHRARVILATARSNRRTNLNVNAGAEP